MQRFEVWGDSHLADFFDVGAAPELRAADMRNPRVAMTKNHAFGGSTIRDWVFRVQSNSTANILVVSSGTNEAIELHNTPSSDVLNYWSCLTAIANKVGKRILFVPPQFRHGLMPALNSAQMVQEAVANLKVASIIPWHPSSEEMLPDGIHYNQVGRKHLADAIIREVSLI